MTHRFHASLVLLAALLGAGCELAVTAAVPSVENQCKTQSDCPGAECDAKAGMCVSTPATVLQIGLEIIPRPGPFGEAPARVTVGPIPIHEATERNLELPPPVTIFGKLRAPGLDGAVPAEVSFERQSAFRGGPSVWASTTSASGATVDPDGLGADYAVEVVAELRYDVVVRPSGDAAQSLPPLRQTVEVPGGGDVWRLDLTYPAGLATLEGVVVDPDGSAVEGLIVQAVTRDTEEIVSSTAVTGATAAGSFRLTLAPEATDFLLRMTPAGTGPTRHPITYADPAFLYPAADGTVRVLVPHPRRVLTYAGRVVAEGDAAVGVPNATLAIRSEGVLDATTGLLGRFTATATTDAQGLFRAELLPGTYEIVVTPPATTRSAVLLAEGVEIASGGAAPDDVIDGATFVLPTQTTIAGTVSTVDGRIVEGATIQALALGRAPAGDAAAVARYNRSTDTVSNGGGRFSLSVDAGLYDVVVKPPAGSGFPWVVEPGLEVPAGARTDMQPYRFPAPVPIVGVVRNRDGTPAAAAEIVAYGLIDEGGGALRAVPMGRAESGLDGAYALFIAPSL